MDDDLEETSFCPSYPWSWKSAGCFVGDFVSTTLAAAAELVENLSVQLAASVNHDIGQREFREAASRDIESITTQEE